MRANKFARIYRTLQGGSSALAFARRALEAWAQHYIARKLNNVPNLEARFGAIEFALLRGQVIVRKVYVAKLSERQKLVEARIEEVCIHVQWRELLHGVLGGRVTVHEPRVQIRSTPQGKGDEKAKKEKTQVLLEVIREIQGLTPFRLDSLKVMQGRVEYFSGETTPPFKLMLDQFSLSASNLTNIPNGKRTSVAHVSLEGRTTGNGQFWLRLVIPSLTESLSFDLQAGLQRVNLVDLNDLLRAYAKFDVRRGVCSVYSEFTVENGHYRGRVEPQFQDLDVFAWQKEHNKSFLQICRQALIALFANLFKNRRRDELALNIGITGTFEDADVDVWAAVGSLLANAFRRSFLPRPPEAESHSIRHRWKRLIARKATEDEPWKTPESEQRVDWNKVNDRRKDAAGMKEPQFEGTR
jgi:hypothetical protein